MWVIRAVVSSFPWAQQGEDLRAVAAVHAAGLEGEVLPVHLRQGEGLGGVVHGHHCYHSVGPGALPGQLEGVLPAGGLDDHVGPAVVGVGQGEGQDIPGRDHPHLGIVLADKVPPLGGFLADDDPLGLL